MNLMELKSRIAGHRDLARVLVKITGPVDRDGCAEITCVQTITNDEGQVLVFSDDKGD